MTDPVSKKKPGPMPKFGVQRSINISADMEAEIESAAEKFGCSTQAVIRACLKKSLGTLTKADLVSVFLD